MEADGSMNNYVKQEQARLRRNKNRLLKNRGGVRELDKVPDVIFIVDINREHNAVAEAAIIGVADDLKGQVPKAFVILSAGMNASDNLSNELRDHVARTIGKIARPDSIEFVETLPKTRSGKIMRRLLKAKEAGQDIGDTSTLDPMSFADEEE